MANFLQYKRKKKKKKIEVFNHEEKKKRWRGSVCGSFGFDGNGWGGSAEAANINRMFESENEMKQKMRIIK